MQQAQTLIRIGVKTIDEQHKSLFEMMAKARTLEGNEAELGNMIKTIEDYIIRHFSEEEKYMLNKNYPEFQSHRGAHVTFMKEFSEIKVDFHLKDSSAKIAEKLDYLLREWWINHVANLDKKLGDFLVSRGVQ